MQTGIACVMVVCKINLFCLVGKDAVELAVPLFRYSAMAGDTDGMYSYGKLLETGD